jgi:hypothetical protein
LQATLRQKEHTQRKRQGLHEREQLVGAQHWIDQLKAPQLGRAQGGNASEQDGTLAAGERRQGCGEAARPENRVDDGGAALGRSARLPCEEMRIARLTLCLSSTLICSAFMLRIFGDAAPLSPTEAPAPPPEPPAPPQPIMPIVLLIRVPKAASATIEASLREWQRLGLCSFDLRVVHSPNVISTRPTAAMIEEADKLIVTHRDPVGRFVSAFNWRHPYNGGQTHNAAQSPTAYPFEDELYACFWHVNDLADALVRSYRSSANRTRCEQLAWFACKTTATISGDRMSMLQAGLTSYLGSAGLRSYLSRPLLIVHVEDFMADLRRMFDFLQCDSSRLGATGLPVESVHDAYPGKNRTQLSAMGELTLRLALHHEYEALYHLEQGLAPTGWRK